MKEHVYSSITPSTTMVCPYCGHELSDWIDKEGTIEYDDCNYGVISHAETCKGCGKRVHYYMTFEITNGVVMEFKR